MRLHLARARGKRLSGRGSVPCREKSWVLVTCWLKGTNVSLLGEGRVFKVTCHKGQSMTAEFARRGGVSDIDGPIMGKNTQPAGRPRS